MTNSSTELRLAFQPDPQQLIGGLPGPEPGEGPPEPGVSLGPPSHVFRLLRPRDLVVLDVLGYGLELRGASDGPVLVPLSAGARLEVRFSFQHLGERAFYEDGDVKEDGTPEITTDKPTPSPVPARTAEASRLVFDVPIDESIGYSIGGVLEAITRLRLRVAPLALPRLASRLETGILQRPALVVMASLPGGLILGRTHQGQLVISATEAKTTKASLSPASGVIARASELRTAVSLLAGETAIDLSGQLTGAQVFDSDALAEEIPQFQARPRPPRADETAIEAPFRLILSPSGRGGFCHALLPVAAKDDPARVEIWHTRLGVRQISRLGSAAKVVETKHAQRIVRAIWARDRHGLPLDTDPGDAELPFRQSLSPLDRSILVRQSADPAITTPLPIDVQRLYLSSLGATLDLHGRWDTTPYTSEPYKLPSILSWDHIAPLGRDQFVRVAYPGYLFPFGHRCALIKITERKIDSATNPVAYLRQRQFLIVSEPLLSYGSRDLPFRQVEIRPLVTPNIADPLNNGDDLSPGKKALFWPAVGGNRFLFTLVCIDHNGRRVRFQTPLLFVAENLPNDKYSSDTITETWTKWTHISANAIQGLGQSVAFAESEVPGDTAFEAVRLYFTGRPGPAGSASSTPKLSSADVIIPAMRHLAPDAPPVNVSYTDTYRNTGFAGSNAAQVFLQLKDPAAISFSGGTDRSGGFLQPDLPIRGLSRTLGTVGEIDNISSGTFNPAAFLAGAVPKLFGLFDLTDILDFGDLGDAPTFISNQLDAISALLSDLAALQAVVAEGVTRLTPAATPEPTEKLRQQAADAKASLEKVQLQLDAQIGPVLAAIKALLEPSAAKEPDDVKSATATGLKTIGVVIAELQTLLQELPLPTALRAELERLVHALEPALNDTALAATLASVGDFVKGLLPEGGGFRASYQWQPRLRNFPDSSPALFEVPEHGLTLSVEARAAGQSGVGVDVLAELRDFKLNLFPDAALLRINFKRLAFRSASGRKAEVDVVFGGIEFVGVLSFIQTLKDLIPFDAFSDPPYLDVSSEGVTAGFNLALPATAIGVFALQNISFGADARVPFLGKEALTFGFNFCTREKPFCLTVMAIGGGGFVAMRLSPRGLVVLEMALEAGACLAISLGVASGSVSVMVGIYLRLDAQAGSLTGYFRIRGEVDVLGLISASITLELALTYEFDSGKMVGRASLEIEVEVFLLSFSVTVTCEKRLAGANGDPTFAQVMGITDRDATAPAWSQYCAAFAVA